MTQEDYGVTLKSLVIFFNGPMSIIESEMSVLLIIYHVGINKSSRYLGFFLGKLDFRKKKKKKKKKKNGHVDFRGQHPL